MDECKPPLIPGINNDVAALSLTAARMEGQSHVVQYLETQVIDDSEDQFQSEQSTQPA